MAEQCYLDLSSDVSPLVSNETLKMHVFLVQAEKKRRAQYSAAVKRKEAEQTERKMAAVARERAWAARLIELKQIEEDVKAVMA